MAQNIIKIERFFDTELSTISRYYIAGTRIKGYVLECPGPDTTMSNQRKRIPVGTYKLKWHNSPSMPTHNPLILLHNINVSESRKILIHCGNTVNDTKGCLIVGSTFSQNRVMQSGAAFTALQTYISSIGIERFEVVICQDFGERI